MVSSHSCRPLPQSVHRSDFRGPNWRGQGAGRGTTWSGGGLWAGHGNGVHLSAVCERSGGHLCKCGVPRDAGETTRGNRRAATWGLFKALTSRCSTRTEGTGGSQMCSYERLADVNKFGQKAGLSSQGSLARLCACVCWGLAAAGWSGGGSWRHRQE